ncbi:helix-turn-helix domain-containing protein, partial [Serratia marcescens]|uniref:helix-turn-helix domain-containing protein n=1 Tax=Serratia marcescens TaxID=615 RepID=UPI0013DC1940
MENNLDLASLRVFLQVAELAHFSRAADELGLPKGRVSQIVRALEAQLGTRLFQRTTRRVS